MTIDDENSIVRRLTKANQEPPISREQLMPKAFELIDGLDHHETDWNAVETAPTRVFTKAGKA